MIEPKFKKIIGLTVAGLLISSVASAQPICPIDAVKPKEVASLEEFKKIPIMDQGRIKPIDTYARNLLLQFSGRRSFGRKPAVEWLARLLFAPQMTFGNKVFLINNPQIPMALGIEPDSKRRYSYAQLEPGSHKLQELAVAAAGTDPKNRTVVEKEILRVFHNLQLFTELTRVFTFAFPHQDFGISSPEILTLLDLPQEQKGQYSFLDVALSADQMNEHMETLQSKKPSAWSETEKQVTQLVGNLYYWSAHHANLPLTIVPSLGKDDEIWLSPWDTISNGFSDPVIREEISLLRDLPVHYWNGKQLQFDAAAYAFSRSIASRVNPARAKHLERLPMEVHYNHLNLFSIAKLFYLAAIFAFLFSLLFPRRIIYGIGISAVLLGFLAHLYALILRILIMGRPPVTHLYETFIFVSFFCVLLGLLIEIRNKKWLGILVAGVSGLVFLMIADKFNAEGDSMRMLVAVLDSNFWLGTHVLTITIGYAGCCLAGILGHVYILQALVHRKNKKLLNATQKNILGLLGFGLTLTFLGTALGGIWADQSWGRFWGWDPKENGALLIILWCAMIFHAKIGRMIGPVGVAAGSVLGLIVVMWAWFGVNLLNVGLHSYGFMSGIAHALIIYVIAEVLFLSVTVPLIKKRS